jgi:anti-sigma factor RsiW
VKDFRARPTKGCMTTTHPSGCGEFEVSIEMELQGALPPERARALAAHLDTCGGCGAFAAEARRTQVLLQGPGPTLSTGSLVERMRRVQSEDRMRRGSIVAGSLTAGALLWWSTGSAVLGLTVSALVALLVLPAVHLRGRRLAAEVARAGAGHDELLAVYRSELEGRLRRWGRLRVGTFLFAVFQLMSVAVGPVWPASLRHPMYFYLFGTAAVCLARSLYLSLRTLPALRRELQELR